MNNVVKVKQILIDGGYPLVYLLAQKSADTKSTIPACMEITFETCNFKLQLDLNLQILSNRKSI